MNRGRAGGRAAAAVMSCLIASVNGCTPLRAPSSATAANASGLPEPTPLTFSLWPDAKPGRGRALERPADPVRGAIARITDVSDPTVALYRPSPSGTPAAVVLVFPGGGYQYLAVDIEGTEVCRWLTHEGIACALVRYRVPQPPDSTRALQPVQDAERAIGVLRQNAARWGLDPRRVGALGFSAGAHVVAVLSARATGRSYARVDSADGESARPDFAMLLYPAYIVRDRNATRVERDVQPNAGTPPTFIVQTEDDPVGAENSMQYASALHTAGVPVELHLYATGGHGYGMRSAVGEVATAWPRLALRWLTGRGVVPGKDKEP